MADLEKNIIWAVAALIWVFFFARFSAAGLMTIAGFMMISASAYYILKDLDLSKFEKALFSFFIAIGLFPTIVYPLSLLISLRVSIIIVFALALLAGFVLDKRSKKKINENPAEPQKIAD